MTNQNLFKLCKIIRANNIKSKAAAAGKKKARLKERSVLVDSVVLVDISDRMLSYAAHQFIVIHLRTIGSIIPTDEVR